MRSKGDENGDRGDVKGCEKVGVNNHSDRMTIWSPNHNGNLILVSREWDCLGETKLGYLFWASPLLTLVDASPGNPRNYPVDSISGGGGGRGGSCSVLSSPFLLSKHFAYFPKMEKNLYFLDENLSSKSNLPPGTDKKVGRKLTYF